jgi:hypothetical protein
MNFARSPGPAQALAVAREPNAAGARTLTWIRAGKPWTKQAVPGCSPNCVYLGEAVPKDVAYPREHVAIIDRAAWDKHGSSPRTGVAAPAECTPPRSGYSRA